MGTLTRGLLAGAVLAGTAIPLAGPAAADPLSGPHTATLIDGGGMFKPGATKTFTFTPCGPECTHLQTEGTLAVDLHLQGDRWTGTHSSSSGQNCTATLDAALVFTDDCTPGVVWQLT